MATTDTSNGQSRRLCRNWPDDAVPPDIAMTALSPEQVTAQNRQAILLVIATLFCFTIMDAAVKGLAPRVGVVPALWVRYGGQMLVVLIIALPRLKETLRTEFPVLQITRSVMLLCATAFFFTGVSLIPLSDATALMMVNPVLITLGAAVFLGEALGPRRLIGIGVALCGALIVVRPGSDVFSAAALLPLCAAVCYSAYVLFTRKVGNRESVWTSLFYTGLVGTVILTFAVPFFWVTPDLVSVGLMVLIVIFGTTGQLTLIRAFSIGEAGMLAPYSYSGLVFASLWGVIFFQEYPDGTSMIGALVIVAAGIYVWHREMNTK